jgi:hypothetical protein
VGTVGVRVDVKTGSFEGIEKFEPIALSEKVGDD